MITYSVQHVLILRLLIQFPFPSQRALQHLLFWASAQNPNRHELGFYDFVRTGKGAFSHKVFWIMQDFYRHRLVSPQTLQVTDKGRDIYYALAGVLRFFEDYADLCSSVWSQVGGNFDLLDSYVSRNLLLRRAKPGHRIFGPEETLPVD